MTYLIDLFSPETYEAFSQSKRDVSGFRIGQQAAADRVAVGDKFICYMTKLSRWIGVLEVTSGWFKDETPRFYSDDDPFVIRFHVRPLAWLERDKCIPIREDAVWNALSFTRDLDKNSSHWTGSLRSSLRPIDEADGQFLEALITRQATSGETYRVDEREYSRYMTHKVRRVDRTVSVSVPQGGNEEEDEGVPSPVDVRESTRIQALLASIGATMGFKIWLPRSDRSAVTAEWKGDHEQMVDRLPLNYDETTLKTIEQIDVLWLRGRAIARAFEVEHTTSIYSGILRMADLLALQPNMDIKLHLVAPYSRRVKVFQELGRPVFSLLDKGPLYESCTYISYDSVRELAQQKYLAHLSDSVLDEYAEELE